MHKNIPALFLAGMFFFSAYAHADHLGLATDLFEKTEWALCRRECKRGLLAESLQPERFQLLEAMTSVRLGFNPSVASTPFKTLLTENIDPQISAIAAYELGRLQWQLDHPEAAFNALVFSFQTTTNKQLFLRSSCSLFLLFKSDPKLKKGQEDLISQINTSRELWYGALFAECAKPDPKKDLPKAPSWIIRFYRSQVSPAIGSRCNLEPSCSEYFHQAHCKHHYKAIPMIADRLVREPGINQRKESPIIMGNDQIRYCDPVENHDFWMKK